MVKVLDRPIPESRTDQCLCVCLTEGESEASHKREGLKRRVGAVRQDGICPLRHLTDVQNRASPLLQNTNDSLFTTLTSFHTSDFHTNSVILCRKASQSGTWSRPTGRLSARRKVVIDPSFSPVYYHIQRDCYRRLN